MSARYPGTARPIKRFSNSRDISTWRIWRTAVADELRSARERAQNLGPRAVTTLGRQQWLDRPSYRIEHALTLIFAAFGRRREHVSNALHGTWLGHPLHPAFTALPTGAVATAMTMDAASVLPGRAAAMRDASRLAL